MEWLTKILIPFKKKKSQKQIVFVVDEAAFHKNSKVKDLCKNEGVELLFIPGGATGVLQPLDVAVNKPFKVSQKKIFKMVGRSA